MSVTERVEKVFTRGVIQDADGNMTHHMHPEGETLGEGIGDQKAGEPCVWCERGIPRLGAIRRVVEGGVVTMTDAETGEQVAEPYRLDA